MKEKKIYRCRIIIGYSDLGKYQLYLVDNDKKLCKCISQFRKNHKNKMITEIRIDRTTKEGFNNDSDLYLKHGSFIEMTEID